MGGGDREPEKRGTWGKVIEEHREKVGVGAKRKGWEKEAENVRRSF